MARCKRCHRVLISAEAVEAGYGAVCFHKMFGKPLPSAKAPKAPRAPSSKSRAKGAKAGTRRHRKCRLSRLLRPVGKEKLGFMKHTQYGKEPAAEAASPLMTTILYHPLSQKSIWRCPNE